MVELNELMIECFKQHPVNPVPLAEPKPSQLREETSTTTPPSSKLKARKESSSSVRHAKRLQDSSLNTTKREARKVPGVSMLKELCLDRSSASPFKSGHTPKFPGSVQT